MRRIIGNAWVSDLAHFIDETGTLHPLLSGPGRRLAEHLTAIVAAATSMRASGKVADVRCRRRPQRRPCPGNLEYLVQSDERIAWGCPCCGDNGVISNWQSTAWDRREMGRV
jgi:hypothetical protein